MSGQLSIVFIEPVGGNASILAERLVQAGAMVKSVAEFQPEAGETTDIVVFQPAAFPQGVAEVVRNWQAAGAGLHLFAVLEDEDVESIPSLFHSGVVAFLHPDAGIEEVKASLALARAEGVYFSKEIATALFSSSDQTAAGLGLTPREQQIMQLLAVNMSNKDIARKLDLSVRTVETHRMNIRKKTGARDRRQVANIAEKLGLMGEEYGFRKPLARRPAAPGFHED